MDVGLAIQLEVELIAHVLVENAKLLGPFWLGILDHEFLKQLLDTLVELQLGLWRLNVALDHLDELLVEFDGLKASVVIQFRNAAL